MFKQINHGICAKKHAFYVVVMAVLIVEQIDL